MAKLEIPGDTESLQADNAALREENERLRAKIEDSERFYEVIGLMSSECSGKPMHCYRFTYYVTCRR